MPLRGRYGARAQWSFQWRAGGMEIALRMRIVRCSRTCIVDLLQQKQTKGCRSHLARFLVRGRLPRHVVAVRGAWNVEKRSALGEMRGVHRLLLALSGSHAYVHVWSVNLSCAPIWRQLVGTEPPHFDALFASPRMRPHSRARTRWSSGYRFFVLLLHHINTCRVFQAPPLEAGCHSAGLGSGGELCLERSMLCTSCGRSIALQSSPT